MNLDSILWASGIAAEIAVFAFLLYRRIWRTLPAFCVYCAWALASDAGNFLIQRHFAASYLTVYMVESIIDSTLQFGILIELAWSVLRPIRASLSRTALLVVGFLILIAGVIIWPLAGIHGLATLPSAWRILVHVEQTASILRILFFLILAGCSQLLSIGWRDRELQVATGLGIYSIVSIAVDVLHSRQAMGPQYHLLNQFAAASYFCCLLYWVFSFATKEAERREFSPQMQNMLLAVASAARTTRVALAESKIQKSGE